MLDRLLQSRLHLHGHHYQNVQHDGKWTSHRENEYIEDDNAVGLCGKVLWYSTNEMVGLCLFLFIILKHL